MRDSLRFPPPAIAQSTPDIVIPEKDRINIADLPEDACKWPQGDGPFYFGCPHSRITGLPYCDFHARRAFTPPSCPWLVVHGDKDEIVDCQVVADWAASLEPAPAFRRMPDTDHFFHGRLVRLRETAMDFLREQAPACQ